MAGAYPNTPSRRMAWDDDGSIPLWAEGNDGPLTQGTGPTDYAYAIPSTVINEALNDEDLATELLAHEARQSTHFAILFPEKREVDGIYFASQDIPTEQWTDHSDDTTNGTDGTWTSFSVGGVSGEPADGYRDNIISKALSNIIAVRAFIGRSQVSSGASAFRTLHFYGSITPGETPDRLLFLDPDDADNEFTLPLDYGDVPRGQTSTDTFKVRNNSGSLTANTVQVTGADLSGGSGSWYTYSDDDITYVATLALGNISPGGTELVHIKQIVPDAQAPAVHAARTKLNVASWT